MVFSRIASSAIVALAVAGHAQANLVVNGSMTGTPAIGTPPPGWGSISVDGDTIPPGGFSIWADGIPASPDGGTFLAILNNGLFSSGLDIVKQDVAGFTAGETYSLSFYYANAALPTIGGYAGPGSVQTDIAGNTFNTPVISFDGIGFQQWYIASYSFVATAATQQLVFTPVATTAQGQAHGINGVVIELIPTPSAAGLFGLAAMAGLRRRR